MKNADNNRLLLLGGGGHCKSVIDAAVSMRVFTEIVITDPGIPAGSSICGCRVAGDDRVFEELLSTGFRQAIVTVGSIKSTAARRHLVSIASEAGFRFINVIDPSAVVSDFAQTGEGVFVGKNAVINTDAIIEDHAIINTGAIVEHECRIGAFTHIAIGARVCGGVTIGRDAFVGAGASVLPGMVIGDNCIIGAGAVVNKPVPDNSAVAGVPARPFGT